MLPLVGWIVIGAVRLYSAEETLKTVGGKEYLPIPDDWSCKKTKHQLLAKSKDEQRALVVRLLSKESSGSTTEAALAALSLDRSGIRWSPGPLYHDYGNRDIDEWHGVETDGRTLVTVFSYPGRAALTRVVYTWTYTKSQEDIYKRDFEKTIGQIGEARDE